MTGLSSAELLVLAPSWRHVGLLIPQHTILEDRPDVELWPTDDTWARRVLPVTGPTPFVDWYPLALGRSRVSWSDGHFSYAFPAL